MEKEHTLRHPYQTRARARVMGEVEEVQKQIKADMEAMKKQMAIVMEAMMSIKEIMEVNATAIAATSTIIEVDLTPQIYGRSGRQRVGRYGRPSFSAKNEHAFPPYGLPPNYTLPNVAYTPGEDVNNFAPILIESRQPQTDHAHVSQPVGKTHEIPHRNLANFEPRLRYATEGQAVGDIPLQNTLEGPQFHPQPQPFYGKIVCYTPLSFADLVFTGERIKVGLERGKSDHLALMNAKTGVNEEDENEGETLAMTAIPTRFPTSNVQSFEFGMTGPLDESIFCFLIWVDPWVLVPIAFRGLHVLDFRGLHALAFRGLHVLAFRGLHALTFKGLHALTFRGLHILTFRWLHVLAFRGLHILTFRGLCVLAFRGLHTLAFRGLHTLAFTGLHALAIKGLHVLAFRGLHTLAFRGLHILTFRGLDALMAANYASTTRGGGRFSALMRRLSHNYYAYRGKISPSRCRRRVWIMCTNMTTLTRMWMTLLLSNILPSDHHSDPPCQRITPPRHPVDLEKSNRAFGFPDLITGFCQFYCPSPPTRSSGPLLIGPLLRSIAPPSKRRARHHNSLGMASSENRRTVTTSRVHLSSSTKVEALPTIDGLPAGSQPPGQVRADVKEALLGSNLELATKKLRAKWSRKGIIEEGSSVAPQADTGLDKHRFQSRFEAIKGLSFLKQRQGQLRDDEFSHFLGGDRAIQPGSPNL
ncbi:Dynein heavy chain [Glycine soja]